MAMGLGGSGGHGCTFPVELDVENQVGLIRTVGVAVNIFKALELAERVRERRDRPRPPALFAVLDLEPWERLGECLVAQVRWHNHTPHAF